ncbi:MAG: nitroreductase family protein [Anaerolineales bacterium]|nr:nitroreductase family protein [Anaerolineales bacterium]
MTAAQSHTQASIEQLLQSSLVDAIRTRRTVRRFLPDPISKELLDEILALAVRAPSAHNSQPWRFVVLRDQEARQALAQVMGVELRASRLQDGDLLEVVEADVARSKARILAAPAAILICMTRAAMHEYSDRDRDYAERMMGVQSTALAAGNLLLAAHASGLGGCWMCAPLFCGDAVRSLLELADDWIPQALILLGHPRGDGKPKKRRAMQEVVLWR